MIYDDRWTEMLGESVEALDKDVSEWMSRVHPDDTAMVTDAIQAHFDRVTSEFKCVYRMRHADGRWRWIAARGRLVSRDADGKPLRMVGTHMDITSEHDTRERAEATMREIEGLWNTIDAHSIVSITDQEGNIVDVNEAFCATSGFTREQLIGQNHRIVNSGHHSREFWSDVWATISAGETWRGEICNRAQDGSIYWVDSIITPFLDSSGKIEKYVSIRQNVTARKQAEEELRVAARTDKLTGLPNRALFNDCLKQAVHRARRVEGYHFAVLFLDFDRFKLVNDSLGHDVGDQLLQAIAERLRVAIRAGDVAGTQMQQDNTAARLGGDEFVLLLDGLAKPQDAVIVAERLLESFAAPYLLGEHEVYSSASIGVVTSDNCDADAEDVVRDADTAMYEAKLAGKSQYVVFDVSMRKRAQNRMNLESDLRKAISGDQLRLDYQPIVNLRTGALQSVEALIRWQHPERGIISPGEFIPLAEDTGLIVQIGEWAMRNACEQFAKWQHELGEDAPASFSVNLSRAQLMLVTLPQTIETILKETGVEPGCLHLEVTESAVMKDAATGIRLLHAIKKIGVKIDLDDFGTGYSSLASLHQFPIDVLKIDRSFIANVGRAREFAALIYAISQLARNLDINVVAEGVETIEQVTVLQSLDCELCQGFLFSKPLHADEIPGFRVRPELFLAGRDIEPFSAA